MQYLDRIYAKPTLCVRKGIFWREKLWKEVKDDTTKYEETVTELKWKGQVRKNKQIFY